MHISTGPIMTNQDNLVTVSLNLKLHEASSDLSMSSNHVAVLVTRICSASLSLHKKDQVRVSMKILDIHQYHQRSANYFPFKLSPFCKRTRKRRSRSSSMSTGTRTSYSTTIGEVTSRCWTGAGTSTGTISPLDKINDMHRQSSVSCTLRQSEALSVQLLRLLSSPF